MGSAFARLLPIPFLVGTWHPAVAQSAHQTLDRGIPLRPGLTLVQALHVPGDSGGDRESLVTWRT